MATFIVVPETEFEETVIRWLDGEDPEPEDEDDFEDSDEEDDDAEDEEDDSASEDAGS